MPLLDLSTHTSSSGPAQTGGAPLLNWFCVAYKAGARWEPPQLPCVL